MLGQGHKISLANILDAWQYFYAVFGREQEYLCKHE